MQSTVPAALDALYTLAAAAMPEPVQVIDGAPGTVIYPQRLSVGYAGDEGVEAVVESQTVADHGRRSDREAFDVECEIAVWTGERPDTQAENRTRAYELLELFTAALDADPTLGGVVMQARRAAHTYTPATTSKGPVARVQFTVHIDAFT